MMRIFTGVDIVEIKRIKRLTDKSGDRFLRKHFTDAEIEYCGLNYARTAGRFAAKEAVFKALRLNWDRGFSWKNIETVKTGQGHIEIRLHGQFRDYYERHGFAGIDVSISYSADYAVASAVSFQLQA